MKDPKVTVLMSVYNSEKYLAEAIDSILNQTFKDFEFLIIDDGSTDSSKEIILSYKDLRIRFIQNESNIGLTKSLNKGIDLARGKYIARMDADDISLPERLEKQVAFMESNPDVAVCGTCGKYIFEDGSLGAEINMNTSYEEIFGNIFLGNQVMHGSAIMQKKIIITIGKYDDKYLKAQDYNLWLRILLSSYKIINIKDQLYFYRINNKMNFSELQEKFVVSSLNCVFREYLKLKTSFKPVILYRHFLAGNNFHGYKKLHLLFFLKRFKKSFISYLKQLPDNGNNIQKIFNSSLNNKVKAVWR